MQISLTAEQEAWFKARFSALDEKALEAAVQTIIDERMAELDLEDDELSWAKPLVDEGVAAIERGAFITLEEHRARNAARLAALKE